MTHLTRYQFYVLRCFFVVVAMTKYLTSSKLNGKIHYTSTWQYQRINTKYLKQNKQATEEATWVRVYFSFRFEEIETIISRTAWQQECAVAGHLVYTAWTQREKWQCWDGSSCGFGLELHGLEWSHPHSGYIFSPQLNTLQDRLGGLPHRRF